MLSLPGVLDYLFSFSNSSKMQLGLGKDFGMVNLSSSLCEFSQHGLEQY